MLNGERGNEGSLATAAPKPGVSGTPWDVPHGVPQGLYFTHVVQRRL